MERTREELEAEGLKVFTYQCDVSVEQTVKDTVAAIIREHGEINVLINNAGVAFGGMDVEEMSVEKFDQMMNINVRGVFLMTKYVLPHMKQKKEGFIINVSSGAGLNGHPHMAAYCASKFAVRGFTQGVAEEAKPYNVRVSAIFPGSVNTDIHRQLGRDLDQSIKEKMIQSRDVAETVFFMINQPERYWIFEATMRSFFMGRS